MEEKKVDQAWKEKISREKDELKEEKLAPPEVDFSLFITTIAAQATIALGNTLNPITNKKEVNLDQVFD
jgi:hypothetical protein